MSTNSPMDVHRAITLELEKAQNELDEFKALMVYSDNNDLQQLRRLADSKRDFIAGLDRARSLAFSIAINSKANV